MSPPPNTAVIIIDPYNDFLHPSGKLHGLLSESLTETDTITHLKEMVSAARSHNLPIYYGLHQQVRPGFLAGWKHATEMQKIQKENVAFEEGTWGVEILEGLQPQVENGDVVVSKHWSSRSVLGIRNLFDVMGHWECMLTDESIVHSRILIWIIS